MDMHSRGVAPAALLHAPGTIPAGARPVSPTLWHEQRAWQAFAFPAPRMTPPKPREVFIQGITKDGKAFRPSDWAERLAGAMSSFRPEGSARGIGAYIGYSPYCVPNTINGVKCVIVSEALRDIEPMAWDFVMNFACDNELQLADACVLPEPK